MYSDPLYTAGIQKAINEKTKSKLTPDGIFGKQSIAGLQVLQKQLGLLVTGLYDTATWQALDTFIRKKYLTMPSIESAANTLKVTPAHIRTVCNVESKGTGYLPDGRITILFERHHFYNALKKRFPANKVEELRKSNSDIISSTAGGYLGGSSEYSRFDRAYAIDPYSAIYATSFGLFQVMGFNHADCGYNDIYAYHKAMQESETNQLIAFTQFLKRYRKGIVHTALSEEDWTTFAFNYNGPNYKANQYDTKLANAYKKYKSDINAV